MKLVYWQSAHGQSPIEDEIYKELSKDATSLHHYEAAEKVFKKFDYLQLRKTNKIDKLAGKNPQKIHEFRMNLFRKIGRILFIVVNEDEAILLHFFSKKTDAIPEKNRNIAELRAIQQRSK